MATTNYAYNDAKVRYSGHYYSFGNVAGKNCKRMAGAGATINIRVPGETFTLAYLTNQATPITYQVDGGAVTTPTLTTDSAWHTLAITGGTAGVYRNIEIRSYSSSVYISEEADAFTSTDAGGTPGALADYPASSTLPAAGGTQYILDDSTYANYLRQEGDLVRLAADGYGTGVSASQLKFNKGNCHVLRFAVTAGTTELWMWGIRNGSATRVLIDGVIQSQVIWASGFAGLDYYGWQKVADLDGSAHTIEVMNSYCGTNATYLWSLYTVGGSLNTATITARSTQLGFLGDSITAVATDTSRSAADGFPWRISRAAGAQCLSRGASGEAVVGGTDTQTRVDQIITATPTPTKCVVLSGTNDATIYGATPSGGQLTTFQSAYSDMITKLTTAPGNNTQYYCCGLLPRGDSLSGKTQQYSDKIQAAVTAAANANVIFVPMESVIVPAGDTYDGIHPTADGHTKIVAYLLSQMGLGTTSGGRGMGSLSLRLQSLGL